MVKLAWSGNEWWLTFSSIGWVRGPHQQSTEITFESSWNPVFTDCRVNDAMSWVSVVAELGTAEARRAVAFDTNSSEEPGVLSNYVLTHFLKVGDRNLTENSAFGNNAQERKWKSGFGMWTGRGNSWTLWRTFICADEIINKYLFFIHYNKSPSSNHYISCGPWIL